MRNHREFASTALRSGVACSTFDWIWRQQIDQERAEVELRVVAGCRWRDLAPLVALISRQLAVQHAVSPWMLTRAHALRLVADEVMAGRHPWLRPDPNPFPTFRFLRPRWRRT